MGTAISELEILIRARDMASKQFAQAGAAATAMSGKLTSAGQKMSATGKSMTLGLTLPIVGFGAAVVSAGAKFESSMNRVGALSSATGDQMKQLSGQAKELGRTTAHSASQAADAQGFLAMAGFETNQILGAMPGTLSLASAGQMDLAQTADIASNILTGFRMKAEDMNNVANILTGTFTKTNTDLSMLGESFKMVGPVAAGVGLEFEEAAAFIGLLGNAGIQATMAGTSMKGSIMALINPTSQQSAIIQQLGLNVTDASGNITSMADVLKQLQSSGAGTTEVMALFGKIAGPGMLAAMSQGSEALSGLTNDLKNVGNISERIAEAQMQGLSGQLKKLKSAFEGLSIAIAEAGILTFFTKVATTVTSALAALGELSPTLLNVGVAILGIVAVIGPLLAIMGAMASGIGALIPAVGTLIAMAPAVVAGIGSIGAALGVSTGGLIFILGAVVAGIIALKKAWDANLGGIQEKVAKANAALMADFNRAINFIQDKFESLFSLFRSAESLGAGAGESLGASFTSGVEVSIPQANAAKMALTDMTVANNQQLLQERGQAEAIVAQRAFGNLTQLEQLQAQKTAELEMLEAHGLSTVESEMFWNEQINAIKNESAIKNEKLANEILATAVKQEHDLWIGKVGVLKEGMAAEIALLEQHGLSTWEVRAGWMRQIRDEEARIEAERTAAQEAAVNEQARIVKSYVDTASAHFEKFWVGMIRGQKGFEKNFMDGVKALINKIIDAYVQLIQGEMIKEIARAQISGPLSFGASLGAIGAIAAAGAAAKAALSAVKFADGGIVNKPTLGIVGEAGPEAIIPLSKAGGMGMGGGGSVFNINIAGTFNLDSPANRKQLARKIGLEVKNELAFFGLVPA